MVLKCPIARKSCRKTEQLLRLISELLAIRNLPPKFATSPNLINVTGKCGSYRLARFTSHPQGKIPARMSRRPITIALLVLAPVLEDLVVSWRYQGQGHLQHWLEQVR
jgi:hypothetical protein